MTEVGNDSDLEECALFVQSANPLYQVLQHLYWNQFFGHSCVDLKAVFMKYFSVIISGGVFSNNQ